MMIPQTRSGDGDQLDVLVPVTKLHIPWNSDRSPTHSSIENERPIEYRQ
jgi:inorganic pyrophosphatase